MGNPFKWSSSVRTAVTAFLDCDVCIGCAIIVTKQIWGFCVILPSYCAIFCIKIPALG